MVRAILIGACIAGTIASQPLPAGGAVSRAQAPWLETFRATSPVAPRGTVRALWVVRNTLSSAGDIDRLVDFCVQARVNLLFVQVRGRGETYYRSSIDPPAADLEFPISEFDPFDYLLTRARREGIAVHAWINVLYVWSDPERKPPPGHVVRRHPEWFLSDASGECMVERNVGWWQRDGIEGYYLDPAHPGVRAYVADVVRELVTRYPVGGVHLDYVRYPSRAFGFDVARRTRMALAWGVDPARLHAEAAPLAGVLGERTVARLDSVVTAERVAAVDSVVAAVRRAAGARVVSAAVLPDLDVARYEKGQDWAEWCHRGWVDFVVPMLYNETPETVAHRLRVVRRIAGPARVLPGLALHDGRAIDLPAMADAVRRVDAGGMVLFSWNVLESLRFPARVVEAAFFSGPSAGP